MAHLRMTTHYEAPIEDVFELAVDYKRYPEWNTSYEEVKEVVGPPDQVGSKMHGVMKLLGRKLEGWGEVTEVERPRLLKIDGSGSGGTVTTAYHFSPTETGTDAELQVDYQLPGRPVRQGGRQALRPAFGRARPAPLAGELQGLRGGYGATVTVTCSLLSMTTTSNEEGAPRRATR